MFLTDLESGLVHCCGHTCPMCNVLICNHWCIAGMVRPSLDPKTLGYIRPISPQHTHSCKAVQFCCVGLISEQDCSCIQEFKGLGQLEHLFCTSITVANQAVMYASNCAGIYCRVSFRWVGGRAFALPRPWFAPLQIILTVCNTLRPFPLFLSLPPLRNTLNPLPSLL